MALRPRQRLPHLSTGPPKRLLPARFLLLLRFLVSAFQLEEVFDLCSRKKFPASANCVSGKRSELKEMGAVG